MTTTINFEMGAGINPRIVRIITTSTLSQVTAAGWLNSAVREGINILPSDKVLIYYAQGSSAPGNAFFDVAIASATGIITLSLTETNVVLPVVSGDFANFSGTGGTIADLGYSPTNAAKTKVVMAGGAVVANHVALFQDTSGTVDDVAATALNNGSYQAGASGTAGTFISYPATATSGSFILAAVANVGNFNSTLSSVTGIGQASAYTLPDPGNAVARVLVGATATPFTSGDLLSASGTGGLVADSGLVANRVLYTSFATPDVNANIIAFDVTVGFAALAAGGLVALITSSGAKQYKIRSLWINLIGTNFSGGGGDRLLAISDGTTVYSVIPAANLQSLVNSGWGISTPLPYPASASINTSTVAGANLRALYSGGAADYTAGSIVISGTAQRVA